MLHDARGRTLDRLRFGPLGDVIDDFVRDMSARGHAEATIDDYVSSIMHVGRWMTRHGHVVETWGESDLLACVSDLARPRQRRARAAGRRLMETLHARGLGRPSVPVLGSPQQELTLRFVEYYRRARGVAPGTCRQYARHVRAFLAFRFSARNDAIDPGQIVAQDLMSFVARCAQHGRTGVAKAAAKALRAFVRYLVQQGVCADDLVAAVPTVLHRPAGLPRSLNDEQVSRLLASFDRSSPIGCRDHAMALCLARLALRVGDVAGLRLDDIDWRKGTVLVGAGKSRRAAMLPLPTEVGQALVRYIRGGRPTTTDRHLFVTHALPVGRPLDSSAAQHAIRRAFLRAGLVVPSRGTHTLRHTAATKMVCQGVSLKAVADVLGHRSLDTTVIYTRIDLPALRAVALPWPEVH